ncbi:MAG: hypothetical protein HC936_10245 [Leptolyngbyaceae cyanobacterium SU_3_3]|nr:hypothetical protein [Leptolyngbyaceae cyanobacterium SU_3_3]
MRSPFTGEGSASESCPTSQVSTPLNIEPSTFNRRGLSGAETQFTGLLFSCKPLRDESGKLETIYIQTRKERCDRPPKQRLPKVEQRGKALDFARSPRNCPNRSYL